MNVTKQQYSKLIGRFWFTQARRRLQVARQLQSHFLSRLNPFIPCVCAFTYQPVFETNLSTCYQPVDNLHGRHEQIAVQSSACSCKSRTWARQYTGGYGAFQDIHGSQEPECDKRGVNIVSCTRPHPLQIRGQGLVKSMHTFRANCSGFRAKQIGPIRLQYVLTWQYSTPACMLTVTPETTMMANAERMAFGNV